MNMNKTISAAVAAFIVIFGNPVFAASVTWNNAGTDFNTGSNWTGGLPGTGDNATFSGSAGVNQPNLSANIQIQGLTFGSTASSGYVLSRTAGSLTLTNTGTAANSAINAANTSGINTISAPIILGGAAASTATFTQAAGGALVISGNISSTNAITGIALTGGSYAGPITLSGSNSYSGNTTLNGNGATQLNINNSNALSSGSLVAASAATIDNTSGSAITLNNNNILLAGTLQFTGTNNLSFGTGVLTVNAASQGTVSVNNAGTLTIGSVDAVDTSKTFRKIGTGTMAITGAAGSNFQGGFTLGAGTLVIGNKTSLGTGTLTIAGVPTLSSSADLSLTNAVANDISLGSNFSIGGSNNLTLSGVISQSSGTRTITVSNTGTTTLTGLANSYSGATTLTGATTVLAVSKLANGGVNSSIGASSNAAASLLLGDGTTLRYTGGGDNTDRLFTISGSAGASVTLDASGSGAINFTNTGSLSHSASNITRTLNLAGINTGNNTLALALTNNGTGAFSVSKNGAGTWVLSGTNTYTGTTSVSAGTLIISGTGSINATTGAIAVSAGSAKLRYDSSVALSRNVTVTGGGTFAYNSAANYSGTFAQTNGSLGGTNWNGTLNNLTIGTNQTISPGNSPGTASTGSQTWAGGGSYLWEINNATGTAGVDQGWDLLSGTGSLSITASSGNKFNILVTSLTTGNVAGPLLNFNGLSTNYQWKIADFASAITLDPTAFAIDTTAFTIHNTVQPGGTWAIALGNSPGITGGDNTQLWITYSIPEPSTWLLLAASLTVVTVLRRRRF